MSKIWRLGRTISPVMRASWLRARLRSLSSSRRFRDSVWTTSDRRRARPWLPEWARCGEHLHEHAGGPVPKRRCSRLRGLPRYRGRGRGAATILIIRAPDGVGTALGCIGGSCGSSAVAMSGSGCSGGGVCQRGGARRMENGAPKQTCNHIAAHMLRLFSRGNKTSPALILRTW